MTARKPFRLTPEQYERLTMPLDENRVSKNPKGFSHLEAWDVRRWLIRVFGFGAFDIETMALDLVKEIENPPGAIKYGNGGTNNKTVWTAVYRAQVRLTVWDQFGGYVVLEDGACGDATNQPSLGDCHDNATKTALSQALKRCAVNLGDQFGLSLYNNGGTAATVKRSIVEPQVPAGDSEATPPTLPTDDAPVLPEPGIEPDTAVAEEQAADTPPPAETTQPEAANTAETLPPVDEAKARQTAANALRDWVLKSGRTTTEVLTARTKLLAEHPERAAVQVINEHGDEEQLAVFMTRRSRDTGAAPAEPADPERRRKRMFALFNDLGYGGEPQRTARRNIAARVLKRDVASMTEVTALVDIEAIITALEDRQREQQRQPAGAAA